MEQWWANLKSNLILKSQIFFTGDSNIQAKSQILNRISDQNLESSNSKPQIKSQILNQQKGFKNIFQFYCFRPMVTIGISIFGAALLRALISPFKASPDNNRANYCGHTSVVGKTKHLKIRSDWVVSNENEYSISTATSSFLFKSRVSWIESLKF